MRERPNVRVILPRGVQIDSFFKSDEHFLEVMKEARWRIIREFTHARSAPGKTTTPNYVAGLDGKPSSLVNYLLRTMKRPVQNAIYSVDDLPGAFRAGKKTRKSEWEAVASEVRAEVVMRAVLIMWNDSSLWYYNGEWSMPQSMLDEFSLMFEKAAKADFYNNRRLHGRPNRERKRTRRLRVAPGMSVSAA